MDSLCHPWVATTNLSYRFPIFETSATTLCGTTGIYIIIYYTILFLMHVNRSKIRRSVHPSSVSIHPPIHPLSLTVTKLHHRDIHEKQTIYCTCISQFVFCMCRKPWGCVLSRMLRYAPEAKSLEEVLLCICMGIAFMAAHPMLLRPLDKWGISSLLACINWIHILQRDYYVAWTGLERIDKEWNIVNDLCCNLLQSGITKAWISHGLAKLVMESYGTYL